MKSRSLANKRAYLSISESGIESQDEEYIYYCGESSSQFGLRHQDYQVEVAKENEQDRLLTVTRTCRYQAIVFVLAYLKIFFIGVIALPFLIWNDDKDFQSVFMLNLVLAVGYLVFGNVIDSTGMKKELTILFETFIGLLFCTNGLLMYFGYSSDMGVQMGVMRVFALMSLFASEIELISLY